MLKKIIAGSLLASSMLFAVNNVEVNINSNTLEAAGEFNLNETYMLSDDANYYLTASYLTSEKSNAASKTSSSIMSAGLKLVSPYVDDRGFTFGLGIKAVVVNNHSKSFSASPLNIFAKFDFQEKISFDGEVHYAPKILTYSSGDSYKEVKVKANYKIIDNGYAFLGSRSIKTNYSDGTDLKFDSSVFFGYKVTF